MSNNFPEGWNKTLDELFDQNEEPSGEEVRWARAYEHSRLKEWARFPENGDIYEAIEDVEIEYLTHWRVPFTGGGECILKAGTKIRVEVHDYDPEPVGVYADPVEDLENEIVPSKVRLDKTYNSFSLSVETYELNRSFKLVT